MKRYLLIFFCLFPLFCVYLVQRIQRFSKFRKPNGFPLFLKMDRAGEDIFVPLWKMEDWHEIVIASDNLCGFTAFNLTLGHPAHVSVNMQGAPETHIVEIGKDYFLLSNGVRLERTPFMVEIDIGDQIFLCGYSTSREDKYVIVYNVTKGWWALAQKYFIQEMRI